jgi:signal transduction histidine kinase
MLAEGQVLVASHDHDLVALSVLISILAAYSARDLSERIRDARGSLGLLGMRERVELLGGSLEVESAPGRGTRIRAVFPLSKTTEPPKDAEE